MNVLVDGDGNGDGDGDGGMSNCVSSPSPSPSPSPTPSPSPSPSYLWDCLSEEALLLARLGDHDDRYLCLLQGGFEGLRAAVSGSSVGVKVKAADNNNNNNAIRAGVEDREEDFVGIFESGAQMIACQNRLDSLLSAITGSCFSGGLGGSSAGKSPVRKAAKKIESLLAEQLHSDSIFDFPGILIDYSKIKLI